jgi:hypothetical protein
MSGATFETKMKLLTTLMADGKLSAAAKVVAVPLLVTFHNNETGRCNPSYASLAEATGRCRRAVIDAVHELAKAGWITIESTGGGSSKCTNKIAFDFERVKEAAPVEAEGVKDTAPVGVKSAAPVQSASRVKEKVERGEAHRTRTSKEPLILNLTIEEGKTRAQKKPTAGDLGFNEFWESYPKRVGRKDAEKEWVKAVRSGASPTQLLDVTKRYAAECVGQAPQFIKEPKNWLRGGHWLDEPTSARPRQSLNPRDRLSPAQEMARAGGWGGSHE